MGETRHRDAVLAVRDAGQGTGQRHRRRDRDRVAVDADVRLRNLSGLLTAAVFAVLLYAGASSSTSWPMVSRRALGNRVHGITLWVLGGYTVYERSKVTPGARLVIAGSAVPPQRWHWPGWPNSAQV